MSLLKIKFHYYPLYIHTYIHTDIHTYIHTHSSLAEERECVCEGKMKERE